MHRWLCCLVLAWASATAVFPARAAPLQIFTLENQLKRWKAYGLRDAQGRVVLEPTLRVLTPLKGGGFLQGGAHGGARLYDSQGRPVGGLHDSVEIVDPELDVMILGAGGHPVLEGKGGLIDVHGRVVVEPIYQSFIHLEGTGLFRFERARRFGAMDGRGEIVLPAEYDAIAAIGGVLVVAKAGRVGVFDRTGSALAPLGSEVEYRAIDERADRLWACAHAAQGAQDTDLCQVLDPQLKPVLPGRYRSVSYLPESKRWLVSLPAAAPEEAGLAAWQRAATDFEILEDDGRRVASFAALSVVRSGPRLIVIAPDPDSVHGGLHGLMDQSGRWLAPARYRRLRPLGAGRGSEFTGEVSDAMLEYVVTVAGAGDGASDRWGVIDQQGRQTLAPIYDQVLSCYPSLGLYLVKQDELIGVVDGRGAWRIAPVHSEVANANPPLPYIMLRRPDPAAGGARGADFHVLYDLETGRPVFSENYEYISVHDSYWPLTLKVPAPEFVIVSAKREGKYGVLDLDGNLIQPFIHENLNSPDRWGRFARYRDGARVGDAIEGLDPARRARLHDEVSRQIRAEHAPLPTADAPHAGRYVPVGYASADGVKAALAAGALSRPVAPMLLLDHDTAILDVGMVAGAAGHEFRFLEYYCPRESGFEILMPGAKRSDQACRERPAAPALVFQAGPEGEWDCTTCGDYGLPDRWQRTDPGPLSP